MRAEMTSGQGVRIPSEHFAHQDAPWWTAPMRGTAMYIGFGTIVVILVIVVIIMLLRRR